MQEQEPPHAAQASAQPRLSSARGQTRRLAAARPTPRKAPAALLGSRPPTPSPPPAAPARTPRVPFPFAVRSGGRRSHGKGSLPWRREPPGPEARPGGRSLPRPPPPGSGDPPRPAPRGKGPARWGGGGGAGSVHRGPQGGGKGRGTRGRGESPGRCPPPPPRAARVRAAPGRVPGGRGGLPAVVPAASKDRAATS